MTNAEGLFKRLSILDAKAQVDSGSIQVLDVRSAADFAGAHVPGALSLPIISIRTRQGEIAKNSGLLFVDADGQRSPEACRVAAEMGFRELYVLDGGMQAWLNAGYPIETFSG